MIIIDKDPRIEIPPICEKDIDSKLIISDLRAPSCQFVSYFEKDGNYIYVFGSDVKGFESNTQTVRRWSDEYNHNNKHIIDIMIKECDWLPEGWELRYLVIENKRELQEFITNYKICGGLLLKIMNHCKEIKF